MKFFLSALVATIVSLNICSAQLIDGSIIISEINYHSDTTTTSGNWFELYNISSSTVNISGWVIRDQGLTNLYVVPNNTLLGGNQYLVVINDQSNFNAQYPGVTNYIGIIPFSLSNGGDKIRIFNDDSELQYQVTYDDTLDWPKGADGFGRTLELSSPSANPNNPLSWFDGCMFGSPGTAYQPCNPPLVFSEINYNSDTLYDSNDWVELHNRSGTILNITGWKFRDSNNSNVFVLPTVSLPVDAYLVLCNNVDTFSIIHPTVTNKVGDLNFGFANTGEVLRLYNAQNILQYSVRYNDKLPWDTLPDGDGYTLELLDPTGHMNDAGNWFAGCFLGSPGTAFDSCTNVMVPVNQLENVNVFPTSDYSSYIVQTSTDNIQFELYDIQGKQISVGILSQGLTTLDMQSFPASAYILKLNDIKAFATYKLIRY